MDNNLLSSGRGNLDGGLGPYDNTSASRTIRLFYAVITIYCTSGGKIGSFDDFNQLFNIYIVIINIGTYRVHHIIQIVGSHIGSHTHCNPRSSVHQEVRNLGRQYGRFFQRFVKVGCHVNRILFQIGKHLFGNLLHPGFRITHSSRTVTVNGTEVSLSVHQRIA